MAGSANSPLVRRGISVEVETIDPAEFDLILLELGDEFLDRVAKSFASLPISSDDIQILPTRIRAFDGYDVCFVVSRTDTAIVVTIMRIWPTPDRYRMRTLLSGLEMLSMVRGAAGI